jgi:hypothetical protein
MAILRTDIERALDELISNEEGMRFQALAVILAKQRCPELIASERRNDGGLDAYAPASLSQDRKAKGLACSNTATITKIKGDATEAKRHFTGIEILIFATPRKVSNATIEKWVEEVRNECGLELVVMPREDIITSLMMPDNVPLCRSMLQIDVPIGREDAELLSKAREAIAEVARNWREHPRLANRPIVSLRAEKIDGAGKPTSEILNIGNFRAALAQARRIALEAPGGGGKTTALVQLATENQPENELSFLIDLPAWIRSGKDVLEFIASMPSFRARTIGAGELARLAARQHFTFLLNGWNEIGESQAENSTIMLRQLERDFPAAGIMVATRTHYITPPLPGALRAKLLPFNRSQRADYLRQTLGNGADELRLQLESSRVLDALTRTPLILAEVVTIFRSGSPLPTSRIGVLGAVMRLIESSDEHRPQLQAAPLFSKAQHYLTELATQMTARGEVEITEESARGVVQSVATALRGNNQIAVEPDCGTILHALCAHHVLERLDYPSVRFRFQHQQFQEYYAARFVADALANLRAGGDAAADRIFAASYINKPMWEEPLRMVAEEIRLGTEASDAARTDAIDSGVRLIRLTLRVDPIFAGDLSRLCGAAVWDVVRAEAGKVLRDWYALGEPHHCQLALAAMLAIGHDDFADILIPLLKAEDRETRINAYQAGDVFYPTSLGANWRSIVESWNEEARADFVFEVTHRGLFADIGESFATTDPSAKVRERAIQDLSWIGAADALTRVGNVLDDAALEAALPAFFPESIPEELRPRIVAAHRRVLARESDPLNRIRRLLRGIELGDDPVPLDLKTALTALSPPLDQYASHTVGEAMKIVKERDDVWASTWVISKLLDGTLYGAHWQPFVTSVSPQRATELINSLATRELQFREATAVRVILSAAATSPVAGEIFSRLCDVLRTTSVGGVQPLAWKCLGQLRDIIRALPAEIALTGIMPFLADPFDPDRLQALVQIYGRVNADAGELRSVLPEPLRQSLRRYLKDGISQILSGNLFDDAARSHAAIALARIGDPDDLSDLRRLIDADVVRQNAQSGGTTYSNWYVEALLALDAPDVDATLLELLREPKYERDVSRALLRLAVPPNTERPWLGNRTDFDAIWLASEGKRPPGFDGQRANRYAQAIKQRISELRVESAAAANPQHYLFRLKDLAVLLAALDGRASADFVVETLTPQSQWDAYARMNGVRALLQSGAVLTLESMLAVLNPAIEHTLSQGLSNDQNLSLLVDCLELLPFSNDPAGAIARIEEVIARFEHRPYHLRDLVTALGYTRSEAVVPFLINLARGQGGLQNMDDAWIEALGRLDLAAARRALLSFIDPEIPWIGVNITFDFRNTERLAAYIGQWARKDPVLKGRLLSLSESTLTAPQKQLLSAIYGEIGGNDAMLASANLLEATMQAYGPGHGPEAIFLDRREYGTSGSFLLIPRNAEQVRAKLFQMVMADPARRKIAFSILGQVEVWRIEYGRPNSEPRHPMIESGDPWPPISVLE